MNMKLALGTAQFGLSYGIANKSGRVGFDEAKRILRDAACKGIDMLDTAIAYGDSEQVLGKIGVADWHVVSKIPALPAECTDVASWVEQTVQGSIDRLGVGQLYAVLLHRPSELFEAHGKQLFDALKHVKERGYARKIGVSVYVPDELEPLFDHFSFDLVQAPLNILDRRLIESGWTQRLKLMSVELHTRSVFLQGLLLMPTSNRPAKFDRWQHIWREWERWLQELGISPLEACLRYVLSVDEVDRAVIGVDSVKHLCEILEVTGGVLPNLPRWQRPIDADLINPSRWNKI